MALLITDLEPSGLVLASGTPTVEGAGVGGTGENIHECSAIVR